MRNRTRKTTAGFGRRVTPPKPPAQPRGQARLAVNLPVEVHKRLKIRAAQEGMTIRQYILSLLEKAGVA